MWLTEISQRLPLMLDARRDVARSRYTTGRVTRRLSEDFAPVHVFEEMRTPIALTRSSAPQKVDAEQIRIP